MADDCRMADWNTGAQPHCSIHGFERNEKCHECRSDYKDYVERHDPNDRGPESLPVPVFEATAASAIAAAAKDYLEVMDVYFESGRNAAYMPAVGRKAAELRSALGATPPKDLRYFDAGGLKWTTPVNVEHLILQLQTLDPEMKVGAVAFIEIEGVRKARTYGLSRSRERWDKNGWLNYKLPGPECLAFWAAPWEPIGGVNGPDTQVLEWKRPAEELPQDGEKVLIEVDYGQTPPQHFVSTMAPCEAFANDRLPFCFRGPGPFRHFGHEIIRWARI